MDEFALNRAANLLEIMARMILENDPEEYAKLQAAPEWMLEEMSLRYTNSANELREMTK